MLNSQSQPNVPIFQNASIHYVLLHHKYSGKSLLSSEEKPRNLKEKLK